MPSSGKKYVRRNYFPQKESLHYTSILTFSFLQSTICLPERNHYNYATLLFSYKEILLLVRRNFLQHKHFKKHNLSARRKRLQLRYTSILTEGNPSFKKENLIAAFKLYRWWYFFTEHNLSARRKSFFISEFYFLYRGILFYFVTSGVNRKMISIEMMIKDRYSFNFATTAVDLG